MAIYESDLLAADLDRSGVGDVTSPGSVGHDREEGPSTEPDRSADSDLQLAIQTIASRILTASLIERAQEAESIAT